MNASTQHHLSKLDRTIVSLLNERARLIASDPTADANPEAHLKDLQRRSSGPFPAQALRLTFESIQAGCAEQAR
ncbi:MAG: hypothetical protein ACI89E_002281 [Planctomycetota bacterium]|jgi:hypothetical protein